MANKDYRVRVEIWRKRLFRKARPKLETFYYSAPSLEALYRMLRDEFQGSRWALLSVDEIGEVIRG